VPITKVAKEKIKAQEIGEIKKARFAPHSLEDKTCRYQSGKNWECVDSPIKREAIFTFLNYKGIC
jgi:hypothetical protein